MSNTRIDTKTCFLRAIAILQVLLVIVLISSCNSETPQLCNIKITLEEDSSRAISAKIATHTIYYRSVYKGAAPPKHMEICLIPLVSIS